MIQLNPPLPLATPKGEGYAHFLIDYGPESDLYWTVFITDTGEIWTFSNREVRATKNITLGRKSPDLPRADTRSISEDANGDVRPLRNEVRQSNW